MNKNILLVFKVMLLLGCSNTKQIIKVDKTDFSVIIRFNKKFHFISKVNLPLAIKFDNSSSKSKYFMRIDYKYSPYSKGMGEDIYTGDNSEQVKNNEKKELSPFETKKYIIYSWYKLDSTKSIQQQFKPYIQKMLAQNKDTLHIGTVAQFKQKHKALFEALTKSDSISIQFLDGKKLGERITVPVEW